MNEYIRGRLVRTTYHIVDAAGQELTVDPDTVQFSWRNPETDVVTTHIMGAGAYITKDSLGHYHSDIDTSVASGIYWYRWEATGTQDASEGSFYVLKSNVLNS